MIAGRGFLTPEQTALIKSVRAMAWNRPFEVQQTAQQAITDLYDDAVGSPVSLGTIYGDYQWDPHEGKRGSEGGQMTESTLALACDIDHHALLAQPGIRLIVDGVPCVIQRLVPAPESGELVVHASRL